MSHEVAIVILNYKNWQDTLECLDSVLQISYPSYRVIVVDNDSQNDSLDQVEKWLTARQVRPLRLDRGQSEKGDYDNNSMVLIQSDSNGGYAAGNNIGIRWAVRAGSPYVLILNNDTMVQKDFLEPLVDFMEIRLDTALTGPLLKKPSGQIDKTCARKQPGFWDYFFRIGFGGRLWRNNPWSQSSWYFKNNNLIKPFEIEVLSGSCMLIRMDFLNSIQLLDEKTFLFAEEYILAEQAKKAGKRIYMIPKSSVIHKHGQSIKKRTESLMMKHALNSHVHYLRTHRKMGCGRLYLFLFGYYILYIKARVVERLKLSLNV